MGRQPVTRLLLDTHVLIWAASVPEKLTPLAASSIEGADQLYISTITGWEVVLLQRKGASTLLSMLTSGLLTSSPVWG